MISPENALLLGHSMAASCCPTATVGVTGFANEGQFLLLNSASFRDVQARAATVQDKAGSGMAGPVSVAQFRPNFLVGSRGMEPFCEDSWRFVQLGPHFFHITGAPCRPLSWLDGTVHCFG